MLWDGKMETKRFSGYHFMGLAKGRSWLGRQLLYIDMFVGEKEAF